MQSQECLLKQIVRLCPGCTETQTEAVQTGRHHFVEWVEHYVFTSPVTPHQLIKLVDFNSHNQWYMGHHGG
jgi:hypothetical protein